MYFALGWPKVLSIPHLNNCSVRQVICNRDKVFFAILSDDTLSIFFCKPCLPIALHRRSHESVEDIGTNESVQWKPDSTMLVVATSGGFLVYYHLTVDNFQKGLYQQVDSPQPNLRRDSAELFFKEVVPPLQLSLACKIDLDRSSYVWRAVAPKPFIPGAIKYGRIDLVYVLISCNVRFEAPSLDMKNMSWCLKSYY